MWQLFWIQNIHYVLEVFVAFLMLTAGWIYLDGWLVERRAKTLLRSLGFFILVVWGLLDAAPRGIVILERLIDPAGVVGFGLVLVSLLIDPIPVQPGGKPIRFFSKFWPKTLALFPVGEWLSSGREFFGRTVTFLAPILSGLLVFLTEPKIWMLVFAALTTVLVRLHYTRGIQSEWKYFGLGFLGLTVALGFALASLWQGSSNVLIAQLLAPFHTVWMLEHVSKFVGALLLGMWAWGFIRFRIFPQIFSSFVALSFIIFVTMTILYTGFLLNRTQASVIADLNTNIRTLDFALRKVKDSAILAARIAATNPQVREAVRRGDKDALFANLNTLMFENETDFMLALNPGGEVLMRAEDKERFGDSLADDPVVWRSLDGKAVVTTFVESGVTIPTVSIRAASPIVDTSEAGEPEIVGVVVTGFLLDNAFVDGIKKITGLDVTVFAHDVRAASTFTVPGSQFRLIGTRELEPRIVRQVLKESQSYTGTAMVLNQLFLAAYIPVQDIEETTIGMFFTGRSQASILALAAETMRLTFLVSILLMMLFVVPLGWLARFITYHQQV